jgi:hypothetical protein
MPEKCKNIDDCFLRKTISFYTGSILAHMLHLPCYDGDEAKKCLTYVAIKELNEAREKLSKLPGMLIEARGDAAERYGSHH